MPSSSRCLRGHPLSSLHVDYRGKEGCGIRLGPRSSGPMALVCNPFAELFPTMSSGSRRSQVEPCYSLDMNNTKRRPRSEASASYVALSLTMPVSP